MTFSFLSSEEFDERAHLHYDAGEYDQALDVLREGLRRYPEAVDLHVGLGFVRLAREEFIWAHRSFSEALAIDPDHEDGWVGLGEALLKFGRLEEALRAFARVEDLGLAEDCEMGLAIGRALYREGLFRESRDRLAALARVRRDSAEVRAALGYTLLAGFGGSLFHPASYATYGVLTSADDRVTIFGESAGGIAVSMLCASPEAKGLFRGAISQSGGFDVTSLAAAGTIYKIDRITGVPTVFSVLPQQATNLGAGFVAAVPPRMGVLHFNQIEVLFPVGALLLERRRAEAGLHPLHGPVLELARVFHVVQVLVAGDRAAPQGTVRDGGAQRSLLVLPFAVPAFLAVLVAEMAGLVVDLATEHQFRIVRHPVRGGRGLGFCRRFGGFLLRDSSNPIAQSHSAKRRMGWLTDNRFFIDSSSENCEWSQSFLPC